jgi:nucleoside-diphosphate-sugar epimerase
MDAHKPVVLITGSSGRLGQAISARLADAYTIVGLERSCQGDGCITADITSDEALEKAGTELRACYGSRIASVIHLAAFYDFTGEPNPLYDEVNVHGTRRLLRLLQAFRVEQFVYPSTMLVHAPTAPGKAINEGSPLAPAWAYPQSKAEAERVVRTEQGNIPVLILRVAGVYSDQGEVPTLAHQIQRVYEHQVLSHVFPGDPSHGQAFVHVDDVATAFQHAVDRRGRLPSKAAVLIGEPVTESYEALQNQIGRLIHGEEWDTWQIPKTVAATGAWLQEKAEAVIPDQIDGGVEPFIKPFMVKLADDHYELDISRAKELLGWQPRFRLQQKIPVIIAGLCKDPKRWYERNKIVT